MKCISGEFCSEKFCFVFFMCENEQKTTVLVYLCLFVNLVCFALILNVCHHFLKCSQCLCVPDDHRTIGVDCEHLAAQIEEDILQDQTELDSLLSQRC